MLHPIFTDIDLVIWDFNGTLLDDAELCQDITNKHLIQFGRKPLSAEALQLIFRHPISEYFAAMGLSLSQEQFAKQADDFHEEYEQRRGDYGLRAGVRDLLSLLQDKGIRQVVLSAYPQKELHDVIEQFELTQFFEALLGLPDRLAVSKVERGQQWMESSGVDPARALLVGDTNHDFEAAQAMGTKVLLCPSGYQHENHLMECGAEMVACLSELLVP